MIVLSPRGGAARKLHAAVPLAENFPHDQGGKLNEEIFEGATINTRRCCALRIISDTLNWAKSVGGLKALIGRADANAGAVADWVARTPWIEFLASESGDPLQHFGLPQGGRPRRCEAPADAQPKFVKGIAAALERRASPTTSTPTRRTVGPAHLVWRDRRARRRRGAHGLARLAYAEAQGRAAEGGLTLSYPPGGEG